MNPKQSPINQKQSPINKQAIEASSTLSTPEFTRNGNNWTVSIIGPVRGVPSGSTIYRGQGKTKRSAVLAMLTDVRRKNCDILIGVCRAVEHSSPEIVSDLATTLYK